MWGGRGQCVCSQITRGYLGNAPSPLNKPSIYTHRIVHTHMHLRVWCNFSRLEAIAPHTRKMISSCLWLLAIVHTYAVYPPKIISYIPGTHHSIEVGLLSPIHFRRYHFSTLEALHHHTQGKIQNIIGSNLWFLYLHIRSVSSQDYIASTHQNTIVLLKWDCWYLHVSTYRMTTITNPAKPFL